MLAICLLTIAQRRWAIVVASDLPLRRRLLPLNLHNRPPPRIRAITLRVTEKAREVIMERPRRPPAVRDHSFDAGSSCLRSP